VPKKFGVDFGPARVSESPAHRLKRKGALNVYELTAVDELIAAHRMAIGEPVSRDDDLGIPRHSRHDAAENLAVHRSDLLVKYRQWSRDLAGTRAIAAALGALVHESPLRELERAEHWRSGSAMTHLRVAVRHFAALRGNTPRGVRGWKVRGGGAVETLREATRRARLER
jgi:hypothetical protein